MLALVFTLCDLVASGEWNYKSWTNIYSFQFHHEKTGRPHCKTMITIWRLLEDDMWWKMGKDEP